MQWQQKMIVEQRQVIDSMRNQLQALRDQAHIAILLRESFTAVS